MTQRLIRLFISVHLMMMGFISDVFAVRATEHDIRVSEHDIRAAINQPLPNQSTNYPINHPANITANHPSALPEGNLVSEADDTGKRMWNLKDVDIKTLIHEVSKVTGKNFVIGPNVTANITFVTDEPLNNDELYQAFLAILQVYDLSAVEEDNLVKIVPMRDDVQLAHKIQAVGGKLSGHQMIVTTIRVNNYPVADLVNTLKPLLPKYSYIRDYKPSNDIIVADRADHIAKLRQLIMRLDQSPNSTLMIVHLRYATADSLAKTLNELLVTTTNAVMNINVTSRVPLKVVPDLRTNSILINGGTQEQRNEIHALIKHLDVYDTARREMTEVFYLRFLPSETFAPILQGLIDSYNAEEEAITGKKNIPAPAGGISSSSSSSGNTRSTNSQFNLQNPLSNYTGSGSSSSSSSSSGGSMVTAYQSDGPRSGSVGRNVQWEASTNSLIVTTSIDLMRRVRDIITKLDIRRPQVLIEVVIAEVSMERALEWGVEWGGSLQFNTRLPVVGTLSSIGNDGTFLNGQIGSGLSLALLHNHKLQLLIRALKADTDSNLLATPNILTLDNEPALIKVGKKVSFAIGQINNNPTGGNPFTSFDREDVGLVLAIKPQITPTGAIRLQIQQELSDLLPVDPARSFTSQNPDTSERFIQTTVMADNGQIIVLGGLLRQDWQRTMSKVPLLGNIPGVGALFRSAHRKLGKDNLMIFLRPIILYNRNDADLLTSGKYEFLRQQQLELERQNNQHIVTPVLHNQKQRRRLPAPFC